MTDESHAFAAAPAADDGALWRMLWPLIRRMPPVVQRTGPVAYVRFHGRNAAQWKSAGWQRYDYDYNNNELAAWVKPLRALDAGGDLTLAIFNNTPRGQAVGDAEALRKMLGAEAA